MTKVGAPPTPDVNGWLQHATCNSPSFIPLHRKADIV